MLFFHPARLFLYLCLWVFSAVLLGLTAARLYYTEHIPLGDPLNAGTDFYNPIVAELCATSVITLLWVSFVIHALLRRFEGGLVASFAHELLGLFVLFVLWLVGAAIATTYWGNLAWCWVYRPCRVLTALVAFAWIGWITLFAVCVLSALFVLANDALWRPMHGRYDPRLSAFGTPRKQGRF